MKALIIILSMFLIISGCAGILDFGQQPLNITVVELVGLEPVHCQPINPWVHAHFFLYKETVVMTIEYINYAKVVQYAYLEKGKLIAYALDDQTGEYVLDAVSPETVKLVINMLLRVLDGKPPIEQNKFKRDDAT